VAELWEIYDDLQTSIATFVAELAPSVLETRVPATPEWTVKDVVAHLTGDATCVIAGDFPSEFFAAFGEEHSVAALNRWTAQQVAERRDRPLENILSEWSASAKTLVSMMKEETPWAEGVPPFATYILLIDVGVHQQDIYGTLGIERDRDGVPVNVGVAAYTTGVDMRLRNTGAGTLHLEADGKRWTAGQGDPVATVRASRFELFRALSGRRSPEQIVGYDWEGDPDSFIEYFYPYGIRPESLIE
jgi:uncharacterized protein (TIGR03083 family)